jgi:hypothetical protein
VFWECTGCACSATKCPAQSPAGPQPPLVGSERPLVGPQSPSVGQQPPVVGPCNGLHWPSHVNRPCPCALCHNPVPCAPNHAHAGAGCPPSITIHPSRLPPWCCKTKTPKAMPGSARGSSRRRTPPGDPHYKPELIFPHALTVHAWNGTTTNGRTTSVPNFPICNSIIPSPPNLGSRYSRYSSHPDLYGHFVSKAVQSPLFSIR